MPLSQFHPAIQRWFTERLGEPTAAQAAGWDTIRSGRHALIAAPTGSGKTLAAFLQALDALLREGLAAALPDEVRVVYVSPLKALSTDIHKNLAEPRREIRRIAEELGLPPVRITAAVRTGDTPAAERTAMLKTPPHILVTTPESLYLLLTAERSRAMLRTARAVIVDEIHAVIESRRGAHLALSLERLDHVAGRRLQRIGLSATQKPIETVARFLVGAGQLGPGGEADCAIVDAGHRRERDLGVEIPGSPLEAVMAGEVWEEIYDRLAALIAAHRTTLVFVNTRRMAERVAYHLAPRLGEATVAAHHGSLAKEVRLDAEDRLKAGKLRALVATASLELGIDIGHVDLVCQLGSPHRITAFLQRVGRSGHTIGGTPRGRLFPLSRDDLVECTALLRAVRRGDLDRLVMLEQPLDVLAQQVVAEAAGEDWSEDALFDLARRAYPYRSLSRDAFDEVVGMLADGFTTRRGRRGAMIHRDAINHRVRGRRGARLTAITSGGAIPDNADYRVVLEPDGTFLGTVNEDFAFESMAGDVFQLGNASWRIVRLQAGVVRVEDAKGELPGIPFWLGEAPVRSDELSAAVSDLRREIGERLDDPDAAHIWLMAEIPGLPAEGATQLLHYLSEARRLLGVLPTQDTLVAERFFDEAGGMQLVIHSPFGSRVNRAWGLALRKRFCRQFNFELQAAATEDGLLLSLGPQHSFPLPDVFRYLHPAGTRDLLVQALLDAPMFGTRWRWNANIALAVLRHRGGRKVPPQIQRMEAEDLLAAAFPDAAACLENIAGDREVPEHPLVSQTIADCLTGAMDVDQLIALLGALHGGAIQCVARDLPEPSVLSHEILGARPYAFLDDAPLEERRAHAVSTRRALEPSSAADLGALDPAAIERVRDEARPDPRDPDELHDSLLLAGFLVAKEAAARPGGSAADWDAWLAELEQTRRAGRLTIAGPVDRTFLVAAERLPEVLAVHPAARVEPPGLAAPAGTPIPSREDAIREVLRGRLSLVGPTTAAELADSLAVALAEVEIGLATLEAEGVILRGAFQPFNRPTAQPPDWCDRRLLSRIHRHTLSRLRSEIEPVSGADYLRFLFAWQHVDPAQRVAGLDGLIAAVEQLDGYELAAGAWEPDVLAARCEEYDPLLLDTLCLTGRVAWGRLSPRTGASPQAAGPLRSTPVGLFLREHRDAWLALAAPPPEPRLSAYARQVLDALERGGASFLPELVAQSGLLPTQVEQGLGELAGLGLVTSDSFAGLRALITPSDKRRPLAGGRRRHRVAAFGIEAAGRWSVLKADWRTGGPAVCSSLTAQPPNRLAAAESFARTLLRRYGVVFRRLLEREALAPPWRELLRVYWRLEARGEIRGGRFVAAMQGEQFALPEAVGLLRAARKRERAGQPLALSAIDPANLAGIVTPGPRVPAIRGNRVLYQDGVPVAAFEAREFRPLAELDAERELAARRAITRKRVTPALKAYLGRAG
jgi:ATP-dependent Lhr-like helicase